MTEDEAKTKWCPFTRVAHAPEAVNGCNRPFEHSYQACIASACMAWHATDNYVGPCEPGKPEPASQPAGYCGLSGSPR